MEGFYDANGITYAYGWGDKPSISDDSVKVNITNPVDYGYLNYQVLLKILNCLEEIKENTIT